MKTSLLRSLVLATLLPCLGALAAADEVLTPVQQAQAAVRRHDLASAEALLLPLTTGEKPDAAACHALGTIRQRQGRAQEAVALMEKATQLDGSKPEYFSGLGSSIGQLMSSLPFMQQAVYAGKLRKAFARSVELDPNHIDGLIGLARFYVAAPEIAGGSVEKATEMAQRLRKLNPFLGELELGRIAEHDENFSEALAHYEQAVPLRPTSVDPLINAGRMLEKLGRTNDARARYEAALQLDPKSSTATQALAALAK